MEPAPQRTVSQVVRGRAIGSRVGTLIAAGWAAYGLSKFPDSLRVSVGLVALGLVVALLISTQRGFALARQLPSPDPAARAAGKRVWRWFWVNLVVEIVLLNVAVNLLAAPSLRGYWIPAISGVVGLHFLPMAKFFRTPSFLACGGAMMIVAGLTAALVARWPDALQMAVGGEALANALILWAAAAWGVRTTARLAVLGRLASLARV